MKSYKRIWAKNDGGWSMDDSLSLLPKLRREGEQRGGGAERRMIRRK